MAKFEDDKFTHIEDDVEKIRKRPTMYIYYVGQRGAHQLCYEIINNYIDEAMSPKSPCNEGTIILDHDRNLITVMDNGRGIPFDKVEMVCSYLQAGSNIEKEKEKDYAQELAGENGVGLTAVNALAEIFTLVIYRDGQQGTFIFKDGKLAETTTESCDKKLHGTTVIFKPSAKLLGPCQIDDKILFEWMNMTSYTIPPKLKMNLEIIKKGKTKKASFSHPHGIIELLNDMCKSPVLKGISIKKELKDLRSRMEIVYNMDADDQGDFTNVKSFCNRVITIENGTHVDVAKQAWCRVVCKLCNDSMTENEKKKLTITFDDCRVGLSAVIVMYTPNPKFAGQVKQKVDNEDLFKPFLNAMITELQMYFKEHPGDTKTIVNLIKKTAKARAEVTKIRKSDYKRPSTIDRLAITGFVDCKIHDEGAELYIVEGDSALGGVKAYRDSTRQAAFKLRGNPLNCYDLTIPKILQNVEWQNIIRIMGAGIGPDFNLTKVLFKKVILLLDSDIDAWNMVSLCCTGFLWTMPQFVQSGGLYRAHAPLYMLKDKKRPYILSKTEYYEYFAERVAKKMMLCSGDKEFSVEEMKHLIGENRNYLDELNALSRYFFTHYEILEFILLHQDDLGTKAFEKKLHERFPELEYNHKEGTLTGVYNLTQQYLMVNEYFFDKCARLLDLIQKTNHKKIYYDLKDLGDGSIHHEISLGTFFKMNEKYLPEIDRRIKGLGELPGKVLWETVLNPKTRELTRLTCHDLERELETVKVLHGNNPELRKELMRGYRYSIDEIDT